MKNRIFVGILLFALFVVVSIVDYYWINFIIFGAILAIAFLESLKLFGIEQKNLVFIALVFFAILPFVNSVNDVFKVILLNITVVLSILAYTKSENLNFVLPFLYPTVPIFMMFALYNEFGIRSLFWLILTVIASDSAGYFVGRFYGRHAFCASSPNKTLEGVLGALGMGVIFGTLFGFFVVDMSFGVSLMCALLISVFGICGDLFESYLKRRVQIKDSGNILGEHGGMLDRIDGYLFGVVAMFLVIV